MPSTKTKSAKSQKNASAAADNKANKEQCNENMIVYELSDPQFIDMGWTVLPKEGKKEKLVTYQAEPAKPHYNWFKERTEEERKYYNNGQLYLVFKTNGTGKVLYPDGQLAIKVTKHAGGTRLIVVNPSGKDDAGVYRHKSLAAMFDSVGNGVIYDKSGKVRLKYSQKAGVLLDTQNGLPVRWNWKVASEIKKIIDSKQETVQDKGSFKVPKEIVDTARRIFEMRDKKVTKVRSTASRDISTPHSQITSVNSSKTSQAKDSISRNHVFQEIANLVEECTKTTSEKLLPILHSGSTSTKTVSQKKQYINKQSVFIPEEITPVKIIVLKINKFISFRILDQSNISLQFNAGNKILRMELGVRVNPNIEMCINEVDSNIISASEVPCIFEIMPTPSMLWTQKLLNTQRENAKIQQIETETEVPTSLRQI